MIFNTCFCILQLEVCLAKSKNSFAALQKSRLELEAQIDQLKEENESLKHKNDETENEKHANKEE